MIPDEEARKREIVSLREAIRLDWAKLISRSLSIDERKAIREHCEMCTRRIVGMTNDAHKQLQERFVRLGKKAMSRLHENRPDLQGKTLNETVIILKIEERQLRGQSREYELVEATDNTSPDV